MSNFHRDRFAGLFDEFCASYLATPEGQRHLATYPRLRQVARENWRIIQDAAAQGADLTELVLLKLLPYNDNENNRRRAAWVHIAPAITGNLRDWYQNAGWTNAESWPQIAKSIYDFVTACVKNPKDIGRECTLFSALPHSKGFQSGMLSPILNALDPEHYCVFNSKICATLNYLVNFNRQYTTKLIEYPGANELMILLSHEFKDKLSNITNVRNARHMDIIDLFSHWLVAIKKHDFGFKVKYYKISPGEGAWQWDECRNGGFIAMGYDEVGDISKLNFEEFAARRDNVLPAHPRWKAKGVNQVWHFRNIREGDYVVANHGTDRILGCGVVTGPYYHVKDVERAHRLPVQWFDTTAHPIPQRKHWVKTVIEIDAKEFGKVTQDKEMVQLAQPAEPSIADPPPPAPQPAAPPVQKYTLAELSRETGLDETTVQRWERAIQRKGQVILYGPPGTGKTFAAERFARYLVRDGGFTELVQFHAAYSYEDFIEGLRPTRQKDGHLTYDLIAGRFMDFCTRARQTSGLCVLILDEINRANLARIFGELMYLLEYRGREIFLASGRRLGVPENVRIIGTMNTADRSIALVDHALRRRFAFLPVMPSYELLRSYHTEHATSFQVEKLIQVLQKINTRINDPHYSLGVSFFLRPDLAAQIEDVWRMEIESYLEEYFFDQPDHLNDLRWEKVSGELT